MSTATSPDCIGAARTGNLSGVSAPHSVLFRQDGTDGTLRPAVFLDRDGVLVDDIPLPIDPGELALRSGVPEALRHLARRGFLLVVVTNQTVVARGLASEEEVASLNAHIERLIRAAGGPALDAWYVCPHHPRATVGEYRTGCACRKPRPGLLYRAAEELLVNLASSFLIGDRESDTAAGSSAGCRTVLVLSNRTDDPPIESSGPWEAPDPDYRCATIGEAAAWIMSAGDSAQ